MDVLSGKAALVAAAIRRKATYHELVPERRTKADRAADYLTNKAPHLDYPTALSRGWPIATGIIEGACRHIVADRLDRTGARWGLLGAEAILKLGACVPTATSRTTSASTWTKNGNAYTDHATRTESSQQPPDAPPREPHPNDSPHS